MKKSKGEEKKMSRKMNKYLRYLSQGDDQKFQRLKEIHQNLTAIEVSDVPLSLPNTQGIKNILSFIAQDLPLNIVSTVCPDYSTRDGLYTFESMGEGVSLLPRLHLKVAKELLGLLAEFDVDFTYYILVADLAEGTDPIIIDKFCDGSYEELLRRCECTRQALAQLAAKEFDLDIVRRVVVGSFSSFYGHDYPEIQESFTLEVLKRKEKDLSFNFTFANIHARRIPLSLKLLAGYIHNPTTKQLEYRTARGIGQYLAHFLLLRLNVPQIIKINHRTINLRFANTVDFARNEEERKILESKPLVPVFVIETAIY